VTGARPVPTEVTGADGHWWLAPPAVLESIEQRAFESRTTVSYQFGDAILRMDTNEPLLVEAFQRRYGDCAVSDSTASDGPTVRCTIWRSFEPQLVVLTFLEGAPPDPAAAAPHLLRPTQAVAPFRVWDSFIPGWRLTGGVTGPILAARGAQVFLHPKLIPAEFLVEYLVGITLGGQPGLLPIHGAALQIGQAGVVLVGASHAGKTTTALHLAARGHALLGDEIALIRLATREVVPFRRTAQLRPGPRGQELAALLGPSDNRNGFFTDDEWTVLYRIAELFPDRPARAVRARAVYFLSGFTDRPSLEPFSFTLEDPNILRWITVPEISYCSWGVAPARRTFRLLILREVLSRMPCWRLTVGPPSDTAALIERNMEELSC
jgi:hypothetical protein